MKRFISRYDKIRQLRAQREDLCRATAAARNSERNLALSQRDAAMERLNTVEAQAASDISSGVSGAILNGVASLIVQARQQLRFCQESLEKAEDLLNLALDDHKSASIELKIVDELIQREKTEHRRTQLRAEDHQLQERASQLFYQQTDT